MPDIWDIAMILAKLALYVGLMGATGLLMVWAAFPFAVSPLGMGLRLKTAAFAVGAAVAALLGFMLQGAALTGSVGGMVDPDMLGLLWQTPVGTALLYRLVGAALILFGLFLQRVGIWVSLAGGALALWSFATIGHVPQFHVPQFHVPELHQVGMRLLLMLHLLGIAFWVGILGPLRGLARQPEHLERAAELGHQFGQVATAIVPALLLAGMVMAWLLLGTLTALPTTAYGQTLLVKLLLVAMVLGLAAANKLRFIPAMQRGDKRATRHLVRAINIETAIIFLVLAATATLTSVLTLPT